MTYPITKTDTEWLALLAQKQAEPGAFAVTRKASTERPFTGKYASHWADGSYHCICCNAKLFDADTKFDAHCGWPSFYAPTSADAVELREDTSLGMKRVEALCARCGSHLGHLFDDAPQTPTGDRFCINSVSLTFAALESGEAV